MKLEIISKYPPENQHATPLLFIHGALHGAWCWIVHFLDYFAQHGYAAQAVNLRGHGNSERRDKLRWTRIADHVEDIARTVEQLPAPPVVDRPLHPDLAMKFLACRGDMTALIARRDTLAGERP